MGIPASLRRPSPASSLLSRLLSTAPPPSPPPRTTLVFGANTDVGKSLLTAGLVLSRVSRGKPAYYLKPLQCGRPADEAFLRRHLPPGLSADLRAAVTLFDWPDHPCSPHLASFLSCSLPGAAYPSGVSSGEVLAEVEARLSLPFPPAAAVFVETAGGVLSPGPTAVHSSPPPNHTRHGDSDHYYTTQAALYSPLPHPALLVADPRLGGVSCTLSALEALLSRGYAVPAVAFVRGGGEPLLDNAGCVRDYLRGASPGTVVCEVPAPPEMPEPLGGYYGDRAVLDAFGELDDALGT
ncbi:hypothetical protein TeGR_g4555 [Tetraparma gracilis]|uniref:Dethiobiotin synthase n=1 Tax=Tetraparma gracilis TaxID=2962635 RepID=A0ABQ6N430_9STRA|nr:hypothetical protein TeGR_g4555 [Tetraparma gracilis]